MPQIRVWQLGDLEKNLLPSKESLDILKEKLKEVATGKDVDIVWGPDLRVQVIETKE